MPLITSPVLSGQEQKTANFNSILSDVEQNTLSEPAKRCLYQGAIELAADELNIFGEASEWLIPYRSTEELKKEAIRLLELLTNPNPDGDFEEDFFKRYNTDNPSWTENEQGEILCDKCDQFKHRFYIHQREDEHWCDNCIYLEGE